MAFYAKDFLSKVRDSKPKSSDDMGFLKSQSNFAGAFVGTTLGIYIGYKRKYNLLLSAFLGGILGAVIAKALINKRRKDKDEAD